MTVTYSGDPSADNKDAVRFLTGDTSTANAQFQDEEILWALQQNSNLYLVAAELIEQRVSSVVSSGGSIVVGDLELTHDMTVAAAAARARSLRRRAAMTATPFAGGLTISSKESAEDDSDRTTPAFTRGMHDIPGMYQSGGRPSTST